MLSESSNQNRLIAEWEPQSGVMLTWPHENSDWREKLLDIENVFIQLVTAITRFEKVLIISQNPTHLQHIQALLGSELESANILYACIQTNDTWCRDYGPLSVEFNGKPSLLDFTFDGWKRKFAAQLDNRANRGIAEAGLFKPKLISFPQVLEGGSIDTNGEGLILTTTECLLENSRNPGMTEADFEQLFATQFGCPTTLWLNQGYIAGDDTDGHIDMLARFVDASTIVYCQCQNPEDEHYAALQAMEQELQQFVQQIPRLQLEPLPLPSAVIDSDGERLPASYANFLIINQAVLLPVYGVPEDSQAEQILARLFPDRIIIPINCTAVITQSGSLHCLTMQLPQGAI